MGEFQHKKLLDEEEVSLYFTMEEFFSLLCTSSGKYWAGSMCENIC